MKRVLLALIFVVACSTIGSAQQYTYYFPHVAIGTYPGGSWQTTIFISNSAAPGTVGSGVITFTKSDGTPYNTAWRDDVGRTIGSGNTIPFQLNSGETRKYVSVATAPLTTGYATVTANTAVLGSAMFTQLNGSGTMLGEAGVPSLVPIGKQAVFVDTTSGFKTGVAMMNPSNAVLEVHLELYNTVGQLMNQTVRSMGPYQHTSFFIHELFPTAQGMIGRLVFYCTNPMVGIGLRFDPTFALFTTMPPIAVIGQLFEADFSGSYGLPAVIRREEWVIG
jgi:hypothetical protein